MPLSGIIEHHHQTDSESGGCRDYGLAIVRGDLVRSDDPMPLDLLHIQNVLYLHMEYF